jgi:hypothetical protein
MGIDKSYAKAIRKDTFEGVELSTQAKKKLEAKNKKGSDNEFECRDEGFVFASS